MYIFEVCCPNWSMPVECKLVNTFILLEKNLYSFVKEVHIIRHAYEYTIYIILLMKHIFFVILTFECTHMICCYFDLT